MQEAKTLRIRIQVLVKIFFFKVKITKSKKRQEGPELVVIFKAKKGLCTIGPTCMSISRHPTGRFKEKIDFNFSKSFGDARLQSLPKCM